MQVKPGIPKGSLITGVLYASQISSVDKVTKQKNRHHPLDFKSTSDTLPHSSTQTNTGEMTKEDVVNASSVSQPLERENSKIENETLQNEDLFFVTEVICL